MATTLKQVAERAGLSVRTVSYIVNGARSDHFRPETARKVRRAAAELGYRPNRSAQAIRAGRFHCAGLILSTRHGSSTLPDPLLAGIHDALARHQMHLTVARLPDEALVDEQFVPQVLRSWMVDGLLINYTDHIPERMIRLIASYRVPSVWINVARDADCVHPDDLDAGRRATRHLIELGHKRIAFLNYSHGQRELDEAHYSVRDRQAGYEQAMREARLEPRVVCEAHGLPKKAWPQHADALLAGPCPPTAVLAYSSSMAVTVLHAATVRGLRCPDDLSIVAFDNARQIHLGHELTVFKVPYHAVGEQAVAMLEQKVTHPDRVMERRPVPFDFHAGETAAPPPARGRVRGAPASALRTQSEARP